MIIPFLALGLPTSVDWQLSSSQITAVMDCGRSAGFLAIMTWYATSSAEAGPLRARLAAFRGSLPKGVHVQPAPATP